MHECQIILAKHRPSKSSTGVSPATTPPGRRRYKLPIVIACVAIIAIMSCAAPIRAQDNTSLGDIARQSRNQKVNTPAAPSKAQELVEQMQQEQEASEDAPTGFKTYNAGDYRLWVPFPFELRDRDAAGVVLASSLLGGTKSLVMVGNPIPFSSISYYGSPTPLSDNDLRNFATQFSRRYSPNSGCGPGKIGPRIAYGCGVATSAPFGEAVSGHLELVRGSNSLYPVMCVVPTTNHGRDAINHPQPGYSNYRQNVKEMAREDQDARNSWQACDVVLQSIRLKEDIEPPSATAATSNKMAAPAKPAPTAALPPSPNNAAVISSNVTSDSGGQPSLALIARRQREAAAQAPKAQLSIDNSGENGLAPPGFKRHSFSYCKNQGSDCRSASVVVPAEAHQLIADCGQPFEMQVSGEPLFLMVSAGGFPCAGRMGNDPSVVRWYQFADPQGDSNRGRAPSVGNLQMMLDGKPATITQVPFKNGARIWISKRADLESNGVPLIVGCIAPREHFADAEAICQTLIDSLRLP
jgi:hypothetical protein